MKPLVPDDADLRGVPWMIIDTQCLLNSDFFGLASDAEFKVAIALWCRSWTQIQAGSPPNDEQILMRWCCVTKSKWQKIRKRALHGWFECADGRLYHPVMAEHVSMAWGSHKERLAIEAAKKEGVRRA